MSSSNDPQFQGEATRAIHAGQQPDPAYGSVATPIYQTASFAYENIDQAIARAAHLEEGYSYTRVANPTTDALEQKLALLDGAEDCVTFASGMGAISALFLGICNAGDHVVCANNIYGATHGLLTTTLQRWALNTTFVDGREAGNIVRAIRPDTRLVYLESPSNPNLWLTDFEAVAQMAHDRGVLVATDNTFATSVNQQPLRFGVDIVVYSATKYISGHGDTLGGAILGTKELLREIRTVEILVGATLSPMNAFLLLRGSQTLPLRIERHNANALAVAQWLEQHPMVKRVYYPGLTSHPQHDLAIQQMKGFGGVVSFEVDGDSTARQILDACQLCTIASSLGDVKTLISQPVQMSHRFLPIEARKEAGITPGLIRLSVGLEDVADIIADLDQAFADAEG
ncbi:MAG TPA: PLP-dependent aspartate aminotransferase family protein [Armatimonadota bacterium]|nr:PLP-dependent aspartate aminotransferase family protein [Armatimonadota bacterium]